MFVSWSSKNVKSEGERQYCCFHQIFVTLSLTYARNALQNPDTKKNVS